LQKENQEGDEINETGKGIMAYGVDLLAGELEYVNLDHIQHFLPLASLKRDIIVPAGEFVPCESPVKAEDEIEEKNECGYEMDEPYGPEPVIERCFGPFHKCRGGTDDITGNAE